MSSTARGTAYEREVFAYFEEELKAGRFYFQPKWSTIQHQKLYPGVGTFDIAIETKLPGMQKPAMFCLIECKDHNRSIEVDDVRAFGAKVDQLASAAAKGIFVSRSSFQSGAVDYAKAKRIALFRFPDRKWELERSITARSAISLSGREAEISRGLTDEKYQSAGSDCICNLGDLYTCSLYTLVAAMTSDVLGKASYIVATDPPEPPTLPFIDQDKLDARCRAIHDRIGYESGPVSLDAICAWQTRVCGLTVLRNIPPDADAVSKGTLGRITFAPPSIVVYADATSATRERFTLAHELSHLLLGHSDYMRAESVDSWDIENGGKDDSEFDIVRRLEWQANRFASSLLLPSQRFDQSARMRAEALGLRDKGFGLIYRDHQFVNERNYMTISSALMNEFAVSRAVVEIRLKTLGLLRDKAPST